MTITAYCPIFIELLYKDTRHLIIIPFRVDSLDEAFLRERALERLARHYYINTCSTDFSIDYACYAKYGCSNLDSRGSVLGEKYTKYGSLLEPVLCWLLKLCSPHILHYKSLVHCKVI